jgi:hypothetical protein
MDQRSLAGQDYFSRRVLARLHGDYVWLVTVMPTQLL